MCPVVVYRARTHGAADKHCSASEAMPVRALFRCRFSPPSVGCAGEPIVAGHCEHLPGVLAQSTRYRTYVLYGFTWPPVTRRVGTLGLVRLRRVPTRSDVSEGASPAKRQLKTYALYSGQYAATATPTKSLASVLV